MYVSLYIDDIDLNNQNETSNDTLLVHRQSNEVKANYSNKKLYLNISISVVPCVVVLLLLAIIPAIHITTSPDVEMLYENYNHLPICEQLHVVYADGKLRNDDVITKMHIEFKDKLCAVSHNETSTSAGSQSISTWSQSLANSSDTKFQVTPGIMRIRIAINDDNIMYSRTNSFYAFKGKYLVSMRVYSNGYGSGEGTHVSVFLHLMKGSNYKLGQTGQASMGKFTIELLNQLSDNDHYAINVTFGTQLPCDCINGDNVIGWGTPYFISHDILIQSNSYYNYCKDDTLYFRISSYDDPDYQVLPTIIRMHDFTKKKKEKEQWYSRPFFAFDGGYQMCLRVDAAGDSEGEGTHVSVYLYLMKGPYDDELEQSGHWPLRGSFRIELLPYKINDILHFPYERKVIFDMYTSDNITNRVINGNRVAKGWEFHKFIPHSMLHKVIADDSVQFKISYQEKLNLFIYQKPYAYTRDVKTLGLFS